MGLLCSCIVQWEKEVVGSIRKEIRQTAVTSSGGPDWSSSSLLKPDRCLHILLRDLCAPRGTQTLAWGLLETKPMCLGAVCLEGKVLMMNSVAFLSSDVYIPAHLSTASPFPLTHNPRPRLWESAENPAKEGLWERRWGFWLSWELRSKAEVMTLSCWDADPLLTLHSQALFRSFPSHLWEQDILLSSEACPLVLLTSSPPGLCPATDHLPHNSKLSFCVIPFPLGMRILKGIPSFTNRNEHTNSFFHPFLAGIHLSSSLFYFLISKMAERIELRCWVLENYMK